VFIELMPLRKDRTRLITIARVEEKLKVNVIPAKVKEGEDALTTPLPDAVLRTVQAAEIAGLRAILVHAISERAKRFYEKWGFVASPIEPMTQMITVAEGQKAMQDKSE
jgi:hypothetical protein